MSDFGSLNLGRDLVVLAAVYVAVLLLLGGLGRRAKRDHTLSDHFLAARGLGFAVLFFTFFATQYSGNTMSAFPGKTYREGLAYFMSVPFMIGIVTGYAWFAPRLFTLARKRKYLTPADFLLDRYGSPVLGYLAAGLMTFALGNFLLAQLMALGHTFAGLTNGRIPYQAAVLAGALVILVYELLGGMRAVAWTDVVQGLMLAVGLALVIAMLMLEIGSPAAVVGQIQAIDPAKVANPGWRTNATWLSTFLLLHLGAPLYPQAIQRIYAARRRIELQRALGWMAVMPLVVVSAVVYIGLTGIAQFPGLERIESDRTTFLVLARLVELEPLAYWPVLLVLMGVLAAIMSTADSALLSMSSMVTKDFVARLRKLDDAAAEHLSKLAPVATIVAMTILTVLAMRPRTTLWHLLEIKFEVLIQLSPAFILGTLHRRDDPRAWRAREILTGLIAGLVVALGLYLSGRAMLGGIHAGVIGVAVNYLTVIAARQLRLARPAISVHP